MKRFSKKGVLLLVGAMSACAFATPSMASAASWGVIDSHHTLDADLAVIVPASGLTSRCNSIQLTARVDNAANLTITTGMFGGLCTSSLPLAGADCTTTWRGTGFPWRVTARTTTLIDIHDIDIDWFFEDMPGRPGSCGTWTDLTATFTGTLTNGHWNNTTKEITWANAPGLHNNALGTFTLSGTARDTQQTLTVTG